VTIKATCPSCGAPVVFRSASSVFAVCEYCNSTLVRHDLALEDIGKMAALVEDRSPLQLGVEGSYKGVHFGLIGRIQLKYSQGTWNEWHLLFDDARTGWLSEAGGEYVLTFAQPVMEPIPGFEELQIGQRFALSSQVWTVSNLERAECIAGEGELPFKVGAGYPLLAADLRSATGFATLDYSEVPPLLFVGEAVDIRKLQLSGLRADLAVSEKTVSAQVFRCPSCAAPLQARSADIVAVGCGTCGAVVDTSDANHRILSRALERNGETWEPRLPLGSKGQLDGQPFEVIGFLVKRSTVDGIAYDWREYLLAGELGTYRWLTEYDNHWNIVEVLAQPPAGAGAQEIADVRWSGEYFRHFASAPQAEVIYVIGEFTWQVRRGERNRVVDYVAPPLMLSRESTEFELSWSLGRYVEPAVIAAAFKPPRALPAPLGVYANQPNPWQETHRRTCSLFWKLALVAVVLQLWFWLFAGGQNLLRESFEFTPQSVAESRQTREFTVSGKPRKLAVRNTTSVDNGWLGLDLLLVNKLTGEAWPAAREVAYYHGYDDGFWSEGSREDEVVFPNVPPGTYYLTLDAELPAERPGPVRTQVEVAVAGAGWSNFILVMLFLAAFPVFTRTRQTAFEVQRWAESDHAPVSSEDDD
jgi:ribosomal protein L37AE/L43A